MKVSLRTTGRSHWQVFIRLACAFALLCVGLMHRPPAVEAAQIPLSELAAYRLPDGSVPELCLTGGHHGEKQSDHGTVPGCEVCRLSASILLPQPPRLETAVEARIAELELPRPVEAFSRQLFPPSAPPRAPPSAITA